ncbi:MAG: hypothetical protein UH625_07015 [Muribaculaceae bacterium]|nr:hypothetical protein [Muribaculaceae bacterium]
MKTLIVIIVTVLLLLAGIILMAFKVLLVKGGKFPEGHAHDVVNLTKKHADKKK